MMQCALGSEAVLKTADIDGQSQPRKLCLMIPPYLELLFCLSLLMACSCFLTMREVDVLSQRLYKDVCLDL